MRIFVARRFQHNSKAYIDFVKSFGVYLIPKKLKINGKIKTQEHKQLANTP